jgi:DNA-3-methyladenine glycosylase
MAASLGAEAGRLPREFYARPALAVAPDLLGCWLVHDRPGGRLDGRIVEVEAYVGTDDLASHASRGRTNRTAVMFGPPGHVYVYLIYGMYNCFNVVTDTDGEAGAILVRALEPGPAVDQRTDGPGRLCRALDIDRRHNGLDLTDSAIWIERRPGPPVEEIATSPRIGVAYAGEWAARPYRFYLPSSRDVSGRPSRRARLSTRH